MEELLNQTRKAVIKVAGRLARQEISGIFTAGEYLATAHDQTEAGTFTEFIRSFDEVSESVLWRWLAIYRAFRWCREDFERRDLPFFGVTALAFLAQNQGASASRARAACLSAWKEGKNTITAKLAGAIYEVCEQDPNFSPDWSTQTIEDAMSTVARQSEDPEPEGKPQPPNPAPKASEQLGETEQDEEAELDSGAVLDDEAVAQAIGQMTVSTNHVDEPSENTVAEDLAAIIATHGLEAVVGELMKDAEARKLAGIDEKPKRKRTPKITDFDLEQLNRVETDSVRQMTSDWLIYRRSSDSKVLRSDVAVRSFVTQVLNHEIEHGTEKLLAAMLKAMAEGWKGYDHPCAWEASETDKSAEFDAIVHGDI